MDYAMDGLLNFVGGCCGTFPSHIAAVVKMVDGCPVRKLPELPKYPSMKLSGRERAGSQKRLASNGLVGGAF